MSQDFLSNTRNNIYKLLYQQIALVCLIAFLWLVFCGFSASWSALAGGVAWIVPNFYFSYKLFIMRKPLTPREVVKKLYLAELIKLVLSGVLVVICVKFLPLKLVAFLSGYCGAVLTIWLIFYAYRNN